MQITDMNGIGIQGINTKSAIISLIFKYLP